MTQRRENSLAKKSFSGTIAQQISLLDVIESLPDELKGKINNNQRRIIEKYEKDPTVVDNDFVLIIEMWKDDGLYEVLQKGSLAEFMYWFMFYATDPASIGRARRTLTSDKDGEPILRQSEDAKKGRQTRESMERAWHQYWRNKDGGHILPEHSIDYFTSRDGIDKHGRPPQKPTLYDIGDF